MTSAPLPSDRSRSTTSVTAREEHFPQTPWLSEIELKGLSELGAATLAHRYRSAGAAYSPDASPEEIAEWQARQEEEDRKLREAAARAAERFTQELDDRLGRAYSEGREQAEAESGRRDALFRGYVLYVVVAAVVLLPFMAILLQLKPETFGSYVAPVTGIAGTIVGYWFGSGDRGRRRSE